MKGMFDFLEKAGLVKKDAPTLEAASVSESTDCAQPAPLTETLPPITGPGAGAPLRLDEIYANEGVGASFYPAERLLRLIDGLSAMDEGTRKMAIRAMDAADESWTIDDPLADATAKVTALTAHAERLQLNLQQLERETKDRLDAMGVRQAQVLGDIRKQMAELEALVARELERGARESAVQEANLKSARDSTAWELGEITQVSRRLQSLSVQFGSPSTPLQE